MGRPRRHSGRHRSLTIEIRRARLPEIDALPAIERSAAEAFRGSSQPAIVEGEVTPAWFYGPLVAQGLVWVACEDRQIIGFAACQIFPDALHLWELAVRHDRQRRGAGRALVLAAIAEARALMLPGVSLTTFRDIPWNGPFYASLGFIELAQDALDPRLAGLLVKEAAQGLDAANRCAMRLSF
jgi:N-acetylglutamate synthase-like GNAT family acetyltransferase